MRPVDGCDAQPIALQHLQRCHSVLVHCAPAFAGALIQNPGLSCLFVIGVQQAQLAPCCFAMVPGETDAHLPVW